jgi:hypothetical protein
MECGDTSPLSRARHVAPLQSAVVPAHSKSSSAYSRFNTTENRSRQFTPCPPPSSLLRFALPAYGGEGLAQGIEDLLGADDVGQTVTVEIGPQG